MNQVQLDSAEIKTFVKHIINNNRFIQAKGMNPVAVEITGDSGLGKTSVILQIGKELNLDVVKLNLAQIEELGDMIGYPTKEYKLCKPIDLINTNTTVAPEYKMVDKLLPTGQTVKVKQKIEIPVESNEDTCVWVDEIAVEQYTRQGYSFSGERRMSYCAPEWIQGKENGGILILDDYTRADQRFQQACMEIN